MAGKFQRYRLDGRGQLQLVRGEGGLAALQQHLPGSPAAIIHLNSLEALWLHEALAEMLSLQEPPIRDEDGARCIDCGASEPS